jgi:hypothetical protein
VVIGARSFNPGVDPTGGFAAQSGAVAQLQTPISANLGRVYAGINPSINNVALGSADFSGSEVTGKDASSNQWSGLVFPRNDTLRAMPGAQTVGYDADQLAQQRLQQYLLRHTERAAFNNGQGVISFSKVSQLNGE